MIRDGAMSGGRVAQQLPATHTHIARIPATTAKPATSSTPFRLIMVCVYVLRLPGMPAAAADVQPAASRAAGPEC